MELTSVPNMENPTGSPMFVPSPKSVVFFFRKALEIDNVFVVGLAEDYCVKYTALQARGVSVTKHFVRYLKWRVHPHRHISCMDTAYVRETPPPKIAGYFKVQDSSILDT